MTDIVLEAFLAPLFWLGFVTGATFGALVIAVVAVSAELLDPLRQLHRGAQSAEAALLARSRVVYATPAWYAAMYWLRRVQTMRERLALCAAALKGEAHDAETFAALRDQATLDLRRRGEPWQGLDAETVVAWWVLRWGWLLADARRAAAAPDPINARAA